MKDESITRRKKDGMRRVGEGHEEEEGGDMQDGRRKLGGLKQDERWKVRGGERMGRKIGGE